ncbi:collagen alpha-3(VI) chain [Elysia marginata]|uniref:Collagen alpha-3(VI) chain n=1 Tax=Elysia marginata TaxID=1093978 RepID=A0AAV4FZD1_9GAST|nr:collagen alpha-3(VI) chain [Elysia marginata]
MKGNPDLEAAMRVVDGIVSGESAGNREDVQDYVVLFTRRIGSEETVAKINSLKARGVRVYGVGIGLTKTDRVYLDASVSSPLDETRYFLDFADELKDISTDFIDFVCQAKDYCADKPCQNGGTCANGPRTFICSCPTGFAGSDCSRTCDDRADIVFLIDSSGSVGFENFILIKHFMNHMVDTLNIGIDNSRVGVVTYSDDSRTEVYLDDHFDKMELESGISGISYEYGNTNTAAGIKMVRNRLFSGNRGDRLDVPNFLVILTDGLSNINSESTLPEAELARKEGIHIITIGVGISSYDWELIAMASEPKATNVFEVKTFQDLDDISEKIFDLSCRDGKVCESDPCQNGGTCKPGIGVFTCVCPQGYIGERCEINCERNKDIAFVIDTSSLGDENFHLLLDYVSNVVKRISKDQQDHKFALIRYSTQVRTLFSFERYETPEQVIGAIQSTAYIPGYTNTAGGLRNALRLFQSSYGQRATADDVVVLITDGQSNYDYWDTQPAATELKQAGVKVMALGIGLSDDTEIKGIASSSEDVHKVSSYQDLKQFEDIIIDNVCKADDSVPPL